MACYAPLTAWEPRKDAIDRRPVFKAELAQNAAEPFRLPCNNCIGCHEDHRGQWVTRLMLESREYPVDQSWFVTTTFEDRYLPDDFSVSKAEMKRFIRRLRRQSGLPVRFFCLAENGDDVRFTQRPHYHFLLFGLPLPDLEPWGRSKSGFHQFVSPFLENVWKKGIVQVGQVTSASVSYCSGYMTSKFRPKGATKAERARQVEEHYTRFHSVTGELVKIKPPFTLCSQGIGRAWAERFRETDLQHDFVVRDGLKLKMPRYFVKKRIEWDAEPLKRAELEKERRREFAMTPQALANATPERLRTREQAQFLKRQQLTRAPARPPERYVPRMGEGA